MPVFEYKAVDMDGSAVAGTAVADTPRQARDQLREQGLTITQLALAERRRQGLFHRRRGQRSQTQVIALIREVATLLQAGIPLLGALQTLSRQHRGHFRTVVERLTDRVSAGVSLADAMHEQPDYFDELCVSIVRVGENTGQLDLALRRLADFKDKSNRLRSGIATAMIYPAVVCVIGIAVTTFLMAFVVPNLLSTLEQSGKPLPGITRAVKGISDLIIGWWWLILLGGGAIFAGVGALLRTDKGQMTFHHILLHIPVLGDLIRKENTSRMAVILAALLRSGLPFVEAVRITRQTLKNRVFRRAMDEYEVAVTAGRDVAGPLEASGVFSPMVVQMLAVGQQAGQLEEMLQQLSDTFDQQVAVATQRFTAVLEPLLIVMLAVLVGFVAMATILPILEVSNVM